MFRHVSGMFERTHVYTQRAKLLMGLCALTLLFSSFNRLSTTLSKMKSCSGQCKSNVFPSGSFSLHQIQEHHPPHPVSSKTFENNSMPLEVLLI